MDKSKIERINELSKKSKTTGLSPAEKQEQQMLRSEYIMNFRNNLKSTLDTIVVVDEQGNKSPLKQKNNTALEKHWFRYNLIKKRKLLRFYAKLLIWPIYFTATNLLAVCYGYFN